MKGIDLQIPVVLDGGKIVGDSFEFAPPEDGEDFQHKETIDETVCCLYRQKKDFISVPYEPKAKDAEYLK